MVGPNWMECQGLDAFGSLHRIEEGWEGVGTNAPRKRNSTTSFILVVLMGMA